MFARALISVVLAGAALCAPPPARDGPYAEQALAACAPSTAEGLLLPHDDCGKFYECSHGRPVQFECPNDLVFNPESKRCGWPSEAGCSRSAPQTSDEIASEPQTSNVLVSESKTPVSDVLVSALASRAQSPAEVCAPATAEGALLAHEDCDKFYECSHGLAVELTCPAGLFYDVKVSRCNWNQSVDCGDRHRP